MSRPQLIKVSPNLWPLLVELFHEKPRKVVERLSVRVVEVKVEVEQHRTGDVLIEMLCDSGAKYCPATAGKCHEIRGKISTVSSNVGKRPHGRTRVLCFLGAAAMLRSSMSKGQRATTIA
jgi:hypothetical protein